jgi:predicted dithiol-disulfide oxidoreductase (DUF899 family)
MDHLIVSHDEWLAARRRLLEKEKEFTRQGDELSRQVRELTWEAVTKEYVFDGRDGRERLSDLFAGRSQLVVYHFMFHPDDKAGCPHCSLRADGFNGVVAHLNQRDVTMVVVSGLRTASWRNTRNGWAGASSGYLRVARTSISTGIVHARGNGDEACFVQLHDT